jgi:hypothetical protein
MTPQRPVAAPALLALAMASPFHATLAEAAEPAAAAEIRAAATAPNHGPAGRPLPLLGSWNTGAVPGGYDPDYQVRLIEQGHHLLPWFQLDPPSDGKTPSLASLYYRRALQRCAELGLPMALISTQWERLLTDDPAFRDLPAAGNPNVVRDGGGVAPMVSPFGPIGPWAAAGRRWGASDQVQRMEAIYPEPPKVVFISNNEHARLSWKDAVGDRRYRVGPGADAEARRRAVGQGWIERYRALQKGLAEGLSPAWRAGAIYVGYNAFGSPAFGRWPGWIEYSLAVPDRIEPWPLAFDGASVPYYLNDWDASADDRVWSPQVEAMNWVFMLEEAYRLNPEFWFELSIWDGHQPGRASDKRAFFARQGQPFTPERYGAMARFGLWLLRPKVLRDYRGYRETRADSEAYFLALLQAVDEVYENPVLREFWRHGSLVANRNQAHPYQQDIPSEYRSRDRWFLLDTNIDPPRPWELRTELPVFALALVKGRAPEREWLVYAQAPHGGNGGVVLNLPEFGAVRAKALPAGGFFLVKEKGRAVVPVARQGEGTA